MIRTFYLRLSVCGNHVHASEERNTHAQIIPANHHGPKFAERVAAPRRDPQSLKQYSSASRSACFCFFIENPSTAATWLDVQPHDAKVRAHTCSQ